LFLWGLFWTHRKTIKGGILKWPPLIIFWGAFLDAQNGEIGEFLGWGLFWTHRMGKLVNFWGGGFFGHTKWENWRKSARWQKMRTLANFWTEEDFDFIGFRLPIIHYIMEGTALKFVIHLYGPMNT
jgi:hypothetical protein